MKISLNKRLLAILLGVLPLSVNATNSFFAKTVKVEGLEHFSEDIVFDYLDASGGLNRVIDDQQSRELIKLLYRSQLFKDVQLYKNDETLIIKLIERPIISSIKINGNDQFKDEIIKNIVTTANSNVGEIYNPNNLFQVKQLLIAKYVSMGYDSVSIEIQDIQHHNHVDIIINISSGKVTNVQGINIIGNKAFSKNEIIKNITFQAPSIWNLWGLLPIKNKYSFIGMDASVEALSKHYMDNGYLDVKITPSLFSKENNKNSVIIEFNISEGDAYKISEIYLKGNSDISRWELDDLIVLEAGNIFSRQKALDSSQNILQVLRDHGYAFANIDIVPRIDQSNKTVELIFYIKPGKKIYINQINFFGNNITKDYVYRRQMQYFESGIYNQSMIDKSKIKLQQLPFVEDVVVQLVPLKDSDDLVNMEYDIKERNANTISASIGYSQFYNFMIGGNLVLPNVQGTGNQFSISTNLSSISQNLNFSYTTPYFTRSGINQSINVYLSRTNYDDTSVANYRLNRYGASINYTIPRSAFDSLSIGASMDHTQVIQPDKGISTILQWFIDQNNNLTAFNTFTVDIGWAYNSTNNAFFPTQGKTLDLYGMVTLPGISELQWYKISGSFSLFHPLSHNFTLIIKGNMSYGNGYGKTKHLPFFQNFYGGGWGSIRGFTQGSMGASDIYITDSKFSEKGSAIGGNLDIYANVDVLFPVPGLKDNRNMRLGMFFDVGNIYNTHGFCKHNTSEIIWPFPKSHRFPTLSNLKYSVGVEFQWLSPLGPMAFSLAKPLNKRAGDSVQAFQFTLGKTF